ncbi:MAG: hypothetical protein L0323_03250, partial [Planctomycetes bacterium]|nr:hypothetical protein [Planctomycetota bacterium]
TVGGLTGSPFPTTPAAYDPSYNGGTSDTFVTRLSPSGGGLLYSTFLGGTWEDGATGLAVDASGAATVTGYSFSSDFPTSAGAFDTTFGGGSVFGDVFVTRLAPSGGSLLFSTFLGGFADEFALAVALDAAGAVTVAGSTATPSFPITAGAYDTTFNGMADAFVTRLSPSGGTLLSSTFLGGAATDIALALALETSGEATVAGRTESSNFPTTAGSYDTSFGGGGSVPFDGFVARLSPSGGNLRYSTFLGEGSLDEATSLASDAAAAATVAGRTLSPNFPTTPGGYDSSANGSYDAFVARLDLLPAGASAYGASTPGCAGPLAIGVTSMPQVGNASFAIACANAPPNLPPNPGLGVIAFSLAALPSPLVFSGVSIWIDLNLPPFFLALVGTNPLGAAEVPLPIPNDPLLAGVPAFAQFFWPDSCAPGGFSASNALAVTVQP